MTLVGLPLFGNPTIPIPRISTNIATLHHRVDTITEELLFNETRIAQYLIALCTMQQISDRKIELWRVSNGALFRLITSI